ncbi:MAG TPA: M23 family metallopeptidase, partial [Thermoanaerobaculia bacterium]|nr:M23 family metallopeptidase [Thermoanaerobaculia bacterium]
ARRGAAADRGPADPGEIVYPLVFPLAGAFQLTDSFGDPRGGGARRHAGVDVLAEKMVPVLAAASGEVAWVHGERGGNCCDVSLVHDDGWRSRYIHLNNDTPGSDDGRAVGIAPGVREGARVVAGQVIGWVGDSGNAEATTSHLHFELRDPDGVPVDPYPSLLAATRRGRPLVAPPVRREPREGERAPGLWGWLFGGSEDEEAPPEPPPAPAAPPPPETLHPLSAPDADEAPVPLEESDEGVPSGSAGVAMAPGAASVELVALEDDCCGDRFGAAEDAKEAERASGWLGCLGFGKREPEPGSE